MTQVTHRLTRIVADDATLEIAQIQTVMNRIELALREFPQAPRAYIANALLNLAVSKLIDEEAGVRAGGILMRLGDVVASDDPAPPPWRAIDLSSRDP